MATEAVEVIEEVRLAELGVGCLVAMLEAAWLVVVAETA